MSVWLASILAAGPSEPWAACGFSVDDGRIALANGAIEFVEPPATGGAAGLVGLSVEVDDDAGIDPPAAIDGVRLDRGSVVPGAEHPNGAFEIDHVVFRSPSLELASEEIAAATGLELRRIRETGTVRQGFHRFPSQGGVRGCIVEIVEDPRAPRSSLWGLVLNVADLDAVVERLGPNLIGEAKDAVQPGRRIATIRKDAGLGVPVALMTPGRVAGAWAGAGRGSVPGQKASTSPSSAWPER